MECKNPLIENPVLVRFIKGKYEGRVMYGTKEPNENGFILCSSLEGDAPFLYCARPCEVERIDD